MKQRICHASGQNRDRCESLDRAAATPFEHAFSRSTSRLLVSVPAGSLEQSNSRIIILLPTYPPLEAYRRDVEGLAPRQSFGSGDARWVAATVALQRYVEASPDDRTRLACELASYMATDGEITFIRAGLRLAEDMDNAGALHLAMTWLTLLERLVPPARTLDLGRVLAFRARTARKLDATDVARQLYEEVERLGESFAEPELTARAWFGFALMARARGNYPEAHRWNHAAALVADDTGCDEQSSQAHVGLLIDAALVKDFDRAVIEGGLALQFARGHPEREAIVLVNVAQILHDTGRYQAALRAFAGIVARTSDPRMLLAALGGAATAAAALGVRGVVDAAAQRIRRLTGTAWAYPFALALIELSEAYALLGDAAAAYDFRTRGRTIASEFNFHALVHRAENPTSCPLAPAAAADLVQLSPAATQVVSHVEELDVPADLCCAA